MLGAWSLTSCVTSVTHHHFHETLSKSTRPSSSDTLTHLLKEKQPYCAPDTVPGAGEAAHCAVSGGLRDKSKLT